MATPANLVSPEVAAALRRLVESNSIAETVNSTYQQPWFHLGSLAAAGWIVRRAIGKSTAGEVASATIRVACKMGVVVVAMHSLHDWIVQGSGEHEVWANLLYTVMAVPAAEEFVRRLVGGNELDAALYGLLQGLYETAVNPLTAELEPTARAYATVARTGIQVAMHLGFGQLWYPAAVSVHAALNAVVIQNQLGEVPTVARQLLPRGRGLMRVVNGVMPSGMVRRYALEEVYMRALASACASLLGWAALAVWRA